MCKCSIGVKLFLLSCCCFLLFSLLFNTYFRSNSARSVQSIFISPYSHMMLILLLIVDVAFSVRVGMISNAKLITSSVSANFMSMTCHRCTCAALSAGAVGWNCIASNGACQLISSYSSNDDHLVTTINGSFFFQKLPISSVLRVSDTTISTATAETTTVPTMTSTTTTSKMTSTTTTSTTSKTTTTTLITTTTTTSELP